MERLSWKVRFFLTVVICGALISMSACESIHDQFRENTNSDRTHTPTTPPVPESVHLAFGNPSNATADPANDNNYLIVGEGSVISYNNSRGTANWVSWRTTKNEAGDSRPRPDFRPDSRLPKWYNRIGSFDYSGSGYDRGHLVPSADRFANPRLNAETFLMTNIVPQTGALNQYPWNKFEMFVRGQAWRGMDVHQIAGCYGDAGRLKNKITVPAYCWKIVMIQPRNRTPEQIDENTRIVAVDMPNVEGIERERWENFKVPVRRIEQKTGYDFFRQLPRKLQDAIETRIETRNPRD